MNKKIKPKILLVEDSPTMQKAIIKYLAPLDVIVDTAADGQEGFELACKQAVDLVITDVDMPRMNGIALCEKLRSEEATASIPIIIQSTFDSESDIDKGFTAGASAYVSKKEIATSLADTANSLLLKASLNRSRRVMIVDDSKTIRRIVKKGLQEMGFQVVTAENGQAALERIHYNALPHLILSDIDMPVMNGVLFCQAVNQNPELATIPFVVMSARQEMSQVRRMLSLGAEAYLFKPFNINELVILIEKLLSDQYRLLLKEKERLAVERNLTLASITSLVKALEARDAYTRGHSADVARIVCDMGELAGMDSESINRLKISGELHDIGKIGIKDSILLKPGRLSGEEFETIKQHPVTGAGILQSIESLSDVTPVVLHHHERFDGKGYPEGLKTMEIPLWARMIAVADTYNALTSDRPYRKGMPIDKAFEIIQSAKGSQLCPECVDLFFQSMDK